jgi:hypothetical protein
MKSRRRLLHQQHELLHDLACVTRPAAVPRLLLALLCRHLHGIGQPYSET